MTLVKFANGQKNNGLNPLFTDVFDSILNDTFLSERFTAKTPAVNIAETENEFHIELAAPGLSKEDFKISVEKNILTVSAEKKAETEGTDKKYSKKEFSYNAFTRTFTLPESVDYTKIDATYTDGILKLNVAKKEEAKIQTREISVK
ncbi:HSP20 family protein [Mucilaginibacter gracilis]|uniref:HSP20 family protein n=1 Tax=Mucilaginibacter gracilis TaxID=423350 RepID=A0A495J591_9SPHI|nr:Hsp20/alpha crystallin family protein [Mucilaginibacter gracilis]RKR83149.1 HSP20 family protein [Mucilaginibacter gracilis]